MKKIIFSIIFTLIINNANAKQCTGRIVNPITDVCWSCILPISIGVSPVVPGKTADTFNFPSPLCVCPAPPPIFVRPGIAIGYWEPIRMVDVTKEPFCFVGIGGKKIDPGISIGSAGDPEIGTGNQEDPATWNVHWYIYPILNLLGILFDGICAELTQSFDVAYITEIDPLWLDDELSFLINPEAILIVPKNHVSTTQSNHHLLKPLKKHLANLTQASLKFRNRIFPFPFH